MVAGIVSPIIIGPMVDAFGVANVLLIVILVSVVNFAYVFVFLRNKVTQKTAGQEQAGEVDSRFPAEVLGVSNNIQDERADSPHAEVDSDDNVLQPVAERDIAGDRRHLPRFREVEPRSDDSLQVELQR